MPAILQQLRARVEGFPITLTDNTHETWTFKEQIQTKDNVFFSSLVIKNPLLHIQYRIQCSHITQLFDNNIQNTDALLQGVETALVLAELLEQIYYRLDEKSNIEQLHQEQAIFREMLSMRYAKFKSNTHSPTNNTVNLNERIRALTRNINLSRQTVNRIMRMIHSTILLDELVILREWVEPIELMTNPVLLHLNWIFFIPRLAVNIILLGKHVILNPWMSEQERTLPWETRLYVHLTINRRWIELINDFVWCTGNLISCFLCVGAWECLDVYLAVGLQLFDLMFTCIYIVIEINRLNTLENEYQMGCANGTISIDKYYFHALQDRISHEKNTGYLAILNHMLLLISILTILPVITALSPFSPILGAALSILTTIGISIAESHLKKQHKHDNITALTQHQFFKPLLETQNDPTHEINFHALQHDR